MTAYHEAGHAVAAIACGVKVRLVDARSWRGNTLASVLSDGADVSVDMWVTAAGPIAGGLSTILVPGAAQADGWFDRYELQELRGQLSTLRYVLLVARVALLVWRWWPAVEAVARELLAGRRYLRGAEVRRLVDAARPGR